MKDNRNNVIRALGDFLSGVTRYESSEHPDSAPEKMRRATAAKAKQEGPVYAEPKADRIRRVLPKAAPIAPVKPVTSKALPSVKKAP